MEPAQELENVPVVFCVQPKLPERPGLCVC